MGSWQLQEAKNKFSEVVETTLTKGPQIITRRGKNTVVVMGYTDYQRTFKPKKSFKELLAEFPALDFPEIERSKDTTQRDTPFAASNL
jgi:antitoxin Phd